MSSAISASNRASGESSVASESVSASPSASDGISQDFREQLGGRWGKSSLPATISHIKIINWPGVNNI